ncbi:MAG: photosystem II biogenesis protein Psp29 [Cyanobacteriota bacterium]|nr:photosystem II biogenesis protein Psp29 [Cyanobacteriota bacterium]
MGTAATVADSKRAFHAAFPHVISAIHRRMVDELLVELHLLSHQSGFQADTLFCVGLVQVFDGFSRGYRPERLREPLFGALCEATGFDATTIRGQAAQALEAMGCHSLEEVRGWLESRGAGAPAPVAEALAAVERPDFHYSRLMAVGLLTLLEQARGADGLEPEALRQAAHEVGEAMGLLKDRLDKDLKLYAGNLEKMAQAVEMMEETVAAERRRRERQAISGQPVAEAAVPLSSGEG